MALLTHYETLFVVHPERAARVKEFIERFKKVIEGREGTVSQVEEWGLRDVFRTVQPEAGLYSWWDYRGGSFHRRRGMRIDLLMASEPVAVRTRYAVVDRNARKGPQPSDHAPVLIDLDD